MYLQNADDDNFYPDDDHDLMDDEDEVVPGGLPDETEDDDGDLDDLDDLEEGEDKPMLPNTLPKKEREDLLESDFEDES